MRREELHISPYRHSPSLAWVCMRLHERHEVHEVAQSMPSCPSCQLMSPPANPSAYGVCGRAGPGEPGPERPLLGRVSGPVSGGRRRCAVALARP
jgi:hypothetical protein